MSNRSRIGRYKVRIYAISCEDLSAKDKGGKSDPYCMFDFDKYRKFNTPVQKKTLNPVYDTDEEFNYATQYADRLQFKHLIINIHDKDFWGKEYIGSAKVDLHTLLTGPVSHSLEVINKGQPAGRIKFKVEMTEIVHLKVYFRSCAITNLPLIGGKEPSCKLKFETDISEHKVDIETTVKRETRNPEWTRLEQLRFNTNFRELMNCSMKVHVVSNGNVIGTGKVPFAKNFNLDGENVEVDVPVKMKTGNNEVKFQACIYFKDFPSAAQMIGGIHTDNGIFDAEYFHPAAEKPRFVKVHGAGEPEAKSRPEVKAPIAAVASATVVAAAPKPAVVSSAPAKPSVVGSAPGGSAVLRNAGAVAVTSVAAAGAAAGVVTGGVTGSVTGAIVGGASAEIKRPLRAPPKSSPPNIPAPAIIKPVLVQPTVMAPAPVTMSQPTIVQPQIVRPPSNMAPYLAKLHPTDRERTLKLGLPAPWSCHLSANGRPYYVNHQTRKTQWISPLQQKGTVRPISGTAIRPARPGGVQGAAVRPLGTAPIRGAAVRPIGAAPIQGAAIRPVGPAPIKGAVLGVIGGQPIQPRSIGGYVGVRPIARPIARPVVRTQGYGVTHRERFPKANAQQIAQLTVMGFNRDLAQEALVRNGHQVNRAIQWLSTSPVPLSMSWDLKVDKKSNNRLYYSNRVGKFTQWDRPIIPQAHEPMLKQLLAMGFPRRLAVEALAHYKGDAQSATNWILYNSPQPLPSNIALLWENNHLVYLNKQTNQRYSSRPYKPMF
ncbi:hypothetical protein AAMO2058_001264000 [Amorphochlora amoebiformis]|uniref:HECT-type E3 ubiquitin transferase n=1 Tax=Amorphochlora amoebiformis TaxID=1561963 RepID=A0A7S0DBK3_9EUKA|mmetsp:Transcript_23274/g.36552  ORF Transcript_23274/g.36552 Transcript_23274/m.36552 type:complete len:768 (+) Transcript_23274:67-2370(+)